MGTGQKVASEKWLSQKL